MEKSIKIQSDSGSEFVYGEELSPNTFKLLENPVFHCRINYGTVVKAELNEAGELLMTKIVRASEFSTRQFMLNLSWTTSELKEKFGQPVLKAGGTWEVVFGGIIFIHIPKSSDFSLEELFRLNNYYPTEIKDDLKE